MRPLIRPLTLLLAASPFASACGGAAEPPPKVAGAEAPPAAAAEKPAEAKAEGPAKEEEAPSGLPTECIQNGDVCTMPKAFVKRLCQDTVPNLALVLFSSGAPWTRAYLTRKTKAWNAEGGASVQDWLEFDEEVLILTARLPPKGGMQVSGMGGYQALRWDGSCVTLATEEVTTRKPPSPKYPRIQWRWLDEPIKEALRKSSTVDAAYVTHRKECKGVAMGEVSKKCEEADHKLVAAIVSHVSSSGGIPVPEKIP